jgi:hypothetical protein
LKETGTPVFGPFVNDIPIRPFEYEYEYEENQWYKLSATIIPEEPKKEPNV